MDKQAGGENSLTHLPIPLVGDINNRRFMTAVLSGVIGGAGVSSAANLLRQFLELRKPKKEETDDETIVLTLPQKAAADAYASAVAAKPGERKVTANGGTQRRENGRYGTAISGKTPEKDAVKCAAGNPGPNTVGTIVANVLGLTAGGLMSYEVSSRLFDALNERRLKRKLQAAQEAYVNAMSGASKRAEAVLSVLNPVEHAILNEPAEKTAGILDFLPEPASNAVRYPMAAYIIALLAGTGATSYVTKKVMDREFPEEKLKKDVNRPTRIVFRTAGSKPSLVEGAQGEEKDASAETCAALTALLPIYMDVVEGQPNRTLAAPYRKVAEANGTDAAGLMKMAAADLSQAYLAVLKDPLALWEILKGTGFGLKFSNIRAADILRQARPDTYRKAVDAAIDAHFASGPNDGLIRRGWNTIAGAATKAYANLGGRDSLVHGTLKSAASDDLLRASYIGSSVFRGPDATEGAEETEEENDPKKILAKVRARLKGRRQLRVQAGDRNAARFVAANKDAIQRILARLNAQGTI